MKKLILSLSMVVLAITTVDSQIRVGVKGGLNISTFTGADATRTNIPGKANHLGLNFGGLVMIPIDKNFTVQPEAYFSMEGVRFDGGAYNLSYINVPVLAKYRFGTTHFALATGPQGGYLINANVKPAGGTAVDIKDMLNKFSYAWVFDGSYEFAKAHFGVDMRYNMGVATIDKGTPKDKFNNSSLQLSLFYIFKGKGGHSKKGEHSKKKGK